MNRKRLGFILMGAGVALAFVVGALVYIQVSEANAIRDQLPKTQVVVATEEIPAGSQIKASQIQLVRVPDQAVPPNAISKVDESVVGKLTPSVIFKGEVIQAQRIGDHARGLVVIDGDRLGHGGVAVQRRVMTRGDGDLGELPAGGAVELHVPARHIGLA